ncbi:MAG: DDE-type integrase/transposase/recombinase [Candidatus Nitrosopolaris sp.]
MTKTAINRQQQGLAIANISGTVKRISELKYVVKSQSGNGDYEVNSTDLGWVCSCPDHTYRGVKCKHIFAVEISFALHKEVEVARIEPLQLNCCIFCTSSNIVKDGLRHNKRGDIQKYNCRECNRYFTINLGFERMRASPQVITSALQLYFTGESFRNVQKFLKLQGVNINHNTIYRWIKKYVTLMKAYLEKITPNVADAWRADELYIKVRGNPKYLFALMDDQTRFWIAQQVADTKYTSNITPLLQNAKEIAGKRPNTFITDGAPNFHEAFTKEFYTVSNPKTRHISHIRLQGDHNNNKMERMNGEVRDREKVMRGLKIQNTAILPGYQIYHNYFRPHEALNGKTPAEKCGIIIEGENKWMTLIQNARKEENK